MRDYTTRVLVKWPRDVALVRDLLALRGALPLLPRITRLSEPMLSARSPQIRPGVPARGHRRVQRCLFQIFGTRGRRRRNPGTGQRLDRLTLRHRLPLREADLTREIH